MKIFITGVAGLVGSSIAKELLNDHTIIGVDNFIGGYKDNIPSNIVFINKDVYDVTTEDLLGVDIVVHAACAPHEGLSVFSPKFITRNTFDISVSLLTSAISAGVKKFVFLSSMARYGTQDIIPFTEDMLPKPQDPYGVSKVAFEQVLKIMSSIHGIDYSIIVPHNIIGPGQVYTDPYRNVAGIMINRMLKSKQPIIYGNGSQMRCFSDIRDVIEPLKKVILTDLGNNQVINIGPDSNFITIAALAQKIGFLLDFKVDPIMLPSRPGEVFLANCSANKARQILGYLPKYSLDETLTSMIDWVRVRGTGPFIFNLPIEINSYLVPKTWTDTSIFNG